MKGISGLLNLSKGVVTNNEIRAVKFKYKMTGDKEYIGLIEGLRAEALKDCNESHFVKKLHGVAIYDVQAGLPNGKTVKVRIYKLNDETIARVY